MFGVPVEAIGVGGAVAAVLVILVLLASRKRKPVQFDEMDDPFKPVIPGGPEYDPFTHGSATDKRRAMRRRGNSVRVLVSDKDAKAVPQEGWVLDRSLTGMCLAVRDAVPVGTVLSVCVADADPRVWIQLTVRNCHQRKAVVAVGGELVGSHPSNVLWPFG